jgi:hypothetical protein
MTIKTKQVILCESMLTVTGCERWVFFLCCLISCTSMQLRTTCSVDRFGQLLQECNVPAHLKFKTFLTAAVGGVHSCAIRLPLRDVYCWPEYTQAARHTPSFIRNATALSLGALHSCAVWGENKVLTCWGRDVVEQEVVNVTEGVRMLAVGSPTSRHTCFLRESIDHISCIGDNTYGQIGLGAFGDPVMNVFADFIRRD